MRLSSGGFHVHSPSSVVTHCRAASLGLASAQAPGRRFLIVLIGPTGSGKTTQSEFLKKEYGIPTVNIDDLIKDNPGALAKYNEPGIDPGVPQSNPAISELVAERLSKLDFSKGVALDGYPATKDQADHLASLAKKFSLAAPVVIQLDVPDAVVRGRLVKRAREDDTPEQIEARLKEYHREHRHGAGILSRSRHLDSRQHRDATGGVEDNSRDSGRRIEKVAQAFSARYLVVFGFSNSGYLVLSF